MATKTDVLIIGGGSIGLNAAYYLLKAGRHVTIVESKKVAAGSSAGNAGHIVPSHIVPLAAPGIIGTALKWLLKPGTSPFGLRVSLDPAYLKWLLQFALACSEANVQRGIPPLKSLGLLSARNFSQLMAEEKFDCFYREAGMIFLYKTASALAGGQHEAEVLHQHGMPAEVLSAEAVRAVEPAAQPDVLGGVRFPGDASINPGHFLSLLARRVRERGATIYEDTPVTKIESTRKKITHVITATEVFEPELVVLAAGAWSPVVARGLGFSLPVQPARGYSLTMRAPKLMPRNSLLLGERRVAVTPMGELLRFTGRLELSELDTTVSAKHIAGIERAVREYLTIDEKLEIVEKWAGLRPTTPDGLPVIGFSPRHSNLLLATGHAMLGLSLGPGTGQVVAEIATGRKPSVDLTPLQVERFN